MYSITYQLLDEKKQLVNREFSYPYYIPKVKLKGGDDCNSYFDFYIVYNHEQTISMAAYRKNGRIRR